MYEELTAINLSGADDVESEELAKSAEKELRAIVDRFVAIPLIMRYMLDQHWSELTEAQRQEIFDLVGQLIVKRTKTVIDLGGRLEIEPATDSAQKQTSSTAVRAKLHLGERDPYAVIFRLKEIESQWRLIDITLEGISIVRTLRQQIQAQIAEHGVANLIGSISKYAQ